MEGTITSLYGYRMNPVLNVHELHNGIDLAVTKGTPALAVHDGSITKVGVSKTYGNYLKYKTDDGYVIMYAHLSEINVSEGDRIKQDQEIALTGDSGLVTGAHLHYSVFLDGDPIDPLSLDFVAIK